MELLVSRCANVEVLWSRLLMTPGDERAVRDWAGTDVDVSYRIARCWPFTYI